VTGDKLGEVTDRETQSDMQQGDCFLMDGGSPHCEDACDVTDLPATCELPTQKVKCECSTVGCTSSCRYRTVSKTAYRHL
jgi:hypothetical protein